MADAVIGSTGFVGGNLVRQLGPVAEFHSRNIAEIRGQSFDTIYCAGVRAEKWKANADPVADWAGIADLLGHLETVSARKMVLISSIDVYPVPVDVDETTPIDPNAASPYGRHRFQLEQELARRFDTTVIRLPGLFGVGIKKNVIFDLLNNNMVDRINPAGVFQYYHLAHLLRDVTTAIRHGLNVVNFATEPLSTAELAKTAFGRELPPLSTPTARYDFRSIHAELFGGRDGYFTTKEQVLAELVEFVRTYRK